MKIENLNGAILVDKPVGISSFGVIDSLRRSLRKKSGLRNRDLPKLGHGGTLDPFASGVLVVLAGRGAKLARYFLGADKEYEGTICFGKTTEPGDPTAPISETSTNLPASLEVLEEMATKLTRQAYLQTPPMYSAKKFRGKPLYEIARKGETVEREPKLCQLYEFKVLSYQTPEAPFRLRCSSGTYVRTLAQDFGRLNKSVAMLNSLKRTASGPFRIDRAISLETLTEKTEEGVIWDELDAWIPFDLLLNGFDRVEATQEEAWSLAQGKQNALYTIMARSRKILPQVENDLVAIFDRDRLLAVARHDSRRWAIERVFLPNQPAH